MEKKIQYAKALNKPQINSSKYWNNKPINVPNWEEFYNNSIILRWLQGLVANIEQPKIFDFGCSDAALLRALSELIPDAQFSGVDYSKFAINKAKENYPFISTEVAGLEYLQDSPDKKYDVIIINHVLEHFEDPQPVIDLLLSRCKYLAIGIPYLKAYDNPEHLAYFHFCSFDEYKVIQKTIINNQSLEIVLKGDLND